MNFTIEFFRVRLTTLTRDFGSDFGGRRQSRGCKGEERGRRPGDYSSHAVVCLA